MPGLVDDEDGNVLRDGVQFFLGRVAQFLELRVVITEADDDFDLLDGGGVLLDPVAQRLLQRGDVLDLAVGRGQEIGGERLQAADDDMPVGVDKAGDEGLALEIHELRVSGPFSFMTSLRLPTAMILPSASATASARMALSFIVRIGPPDQMRSAV